MAGTDRNVNGTAQVAASTWTHLAATYDGANIRIFVNGTQAATVAQTGAITTSTGVLHIGGNAIWPEWFQGLIDEVRIYNRALSATEIQADMATSIGNQDTSPPTAPAGLTPVVGLNSVALSWTASTDNVGVVRYNVHRSTTAGFTPSAANRIAQPAGHLVHGQPALAGDLLLPRHGRGRRGEHQRRVRGGERRRHGRHLAPDAALERRRERTR